MSEPSRVCPNCGAESPPQTETCARCRVPLVDALPSGSRTPNLAATSDAQRRTVELGALTLRRVGSVMRFVGAAGVFVAVIQTFGNLSSANEVDFRSGVEKLSIVLSAYSMLLFAVLVFGFGTLARLVASWALLRLTPTGFDAGLSGQAAQDQPQLT